jgi:arginyl-tRNA synthetase
MSGSPTSATHLDPAAALAALFSRALARAGEALGAVDACSTADPMVRRSDRADYQANFAMGLAKRVGKPPRVIAEAVVRELAASGAEGLVAKAELAGPGFVNVTLHPDWLAGAVGRALTHPAAGVHPSPTPERVVIDYSAPNVAKEMHVGHLRSTILGDCLARVLELRGHTVLRQNHIGDWGTPFGMLIEHLVELGEAEATNEVGLGELSAFYKAARKKFDESAEFAERSRRRVTLLQGGDATTLRLWRVLVELSKRYFSTVYDKLDVTLADGDVCGESFYNERLAPLAAELEAQGAASIDQGALCLFIEGFVGQDGAPVPLIVRKSDGGFGYATTDLAAIRYRVRDLAATRLLYVVGAPQAQHLAMVFAAARTLGWLREPARAEHVAFGSVLGTDKRMFRSRSGETVRLIDLLDEAIQRALIEVQAKATGLSPEEQLDVARMVGVGAVKYADLSSDRVKDYVFDLERMIAFQGNTAGYLQYAHARICSILRAGDAAEAADGTSPSEVVFSSVADEAAAERALALALLSLGGAVQAVEDTLEPHRLCTYLYDVATAFTVFYDRCPVRKAEPPLRASRLALCRLTARVLEVGTGLLGIRVPARM